MSKDNNATLWASRVTILKDKVEAGEERLEQVNAAASQLIAEEAPETKIADTKRDAQAADIDLTHLRRALMDAQLALEGAREAEETEGVKTRASHIKKLQSRRERVLDEAGGYFKQFMDKIADSEKLAIQIHQAAGGCRTVGDDLNKRHGPIAAWMITRIVEALPTAEQAIGATIANHNHAKQQMAGKALADLQPDYTLMFRQYHTPKVEKVHVPKEKSIYDFAMDGEEEEAA
jgi:hypothetical protein